MQLWLNKSEVEALQDSQWVVILTILVHPEEKVTDLSSDVKMQFALLKWELQMYWNMFLEFVQINYYENKWICGIAFTKSAVTKIP